MTTHILARPAPAPRHDGPSAWDKVQLARHPQRPHTLDYIRRLCRPFFEFRGDRCFGDDQAIVGGVGQTQVGPVVVVGHQKGRTTRENLRHNFGMPHPEGFRKAQRLMRHAQKFGLPLVCFIDTPGAHPSVAAEERGQSSAIAQSLISMASLETPIVSIVIGEANSGGALALGIADRVLMLEHAVYAVASPEAASMILWRDAGRAPEVAASMKLTAQDLEQFGIIDEIVAEPEHGAAADPETCLTSTTARVIYHVADLSRIDRVQLVHQRRARYRSLV